LSIAGQKFRGMIEHFCGISAFLFIYSTISRGTLVGKHCSRATVNPTQIFAWWVLGALSPGVKRLGREGNRSLSYIGEVNNVSRLLPALTLCICTSSCTLAGQCDPVSDIKMESKFVLDEDCL